VRTVSKKLDKIELVQFGTSTPKVDRVQAASGPRLSVRAVPSISADTRVSANPYELHFA